MEEIENQLEEIASWRVKELRLQEKVKMNETKLVDFSLFESKYIKVELDEPKMLLITKWESTTATYETGEVAAVKFFVKEEDGRQVDKQWVVSSKRLIQELRPFIERSEKLDHPRFRVRVLRSGLGKNSRYSVKEVS